MENSIKSFRTEGVTLHYTESGNGQPLLFIPGSISDYRTWTHMVTRFSPKYHCFALSRRFQYPDRYPDRGDSSVTANTNDIALFIKENIHAPVNIIGHSFGGFVALNLAIQFPDLVKSVIAEEPVFAPAWVKNPKNPIELLRFILRDYKAGISFMRLGIKGIDPTFKALAKGDTSTAQQTFINGVTNGKKTPDTLDELTFIQLRDNIAALAGEDPFNNTLTMNDLKKIKCPVLLLSGIESPYAFQYINLRLQQFISQSKSVSIDGSGHWVHIAQEEKYFRTVSGFLDAHSLHI